MPDDDERRPDAPPDPAPKWEWLDVVVPDDISALEPEIQAYRAEIRARRRRERTDRWLGPRWRRHAVPGVIAAAVLLIVAIVGTTLTLLQPRLQRQRVPQAPLAAPPAQSGTPGGLVPDLKLAGRTGEVALREQRPALIALLPESCRCGKLIDTLAGQAAEFHLDLLAVAPSRDDPELETAVRQARRGRAVPLRDSDARLARAYRAEGVTILPLAPNGVVPQVLRRVDEQTRLEPHLLAMLTPSARSVGVPEVSGGNPAPPRAG